MKKANIQNIAMTMIILFAASVIFVAVKYSYGTFVDIATNNTQFNSSPAAVSALDTTKDLTNRYDYVLFVLLIGFTLAIIVSGWFASGHPIFAFAYFIALVILVVVSAIFSFVWERVSTTAIFVPTVEQFPIMDLILTHFPTYIAIIGFIGMLVLFAKPSFTQ